MEFEATKAFLCVARRRSGELREGRENETREREGKRER
jgi:hypothetical protein